LLYAAQQQVQLRTYANWQTSFRKEDLSFTA
jgi:hypothetical protein